MSEGTTALTNFRKGLSVIFFSDCDGAAKIKRGVNANSAAIE